MSKQHDPKHGNGNGTARTGAEAFELKVGLAEMLKGGVIMDVTTPEQAKIAEDAGACAVMALERVPSDIRKEGGVARMCSIAVIEGIQRTVSIPVMAKVRIGHFIEARVLESLGVDFIDESEVLTPADDAHHVDKLAFKVPFVCGCRDLGEALRRIGEGAAMIRTKGEAGSGNIVEAVRHLRTVVGGMRRLTVLPPEELPAAAKELRAPISFAKAGISSRVIEVARRIWAVIVRMWRTASTTLPVPASPLVRIMAAPSPSRRSASPRSRAPQTNGIRKACLSMWNISSAGVRTSLSSM